MPKSLRRDRFKPKTKPRVGLELCRSFPDDKNVYDIRAFATGNRFNRVEADYYARVLGEALPQAKVTSNQWAVHLEPTKRGDRRFIKAVMEEIGKHFVIVEVEGDKGK